MNDTYGLLDIRGLVLRQYHGCRDRSFEAAERAIPSWQAAMDDLLSELLLPLLERHAPRQLIAVWDAGNTYRLSVSSQYKAARHAKETDPAIKEQTKRMLEATRELLASLGVKQVKVPGEEADDVIAHLAEKLPGAKMIYTTDQDLVVLAALPDTHVIRRVGNDISLYSATDLFGGIPVRFVSLRKSLVGDSTDGYTGVKGFGETRFKQLWDRYGEAGLDWLAHCIETDDAEALKPYPDLAMLYQKWSEWRIGWQLAKLNPGVCYGVYRGKPKRPVWDVRVPAISRLAPLLSEIGRFVSTDAYAYSEVWIQRLKRWLPTEELIEVAQAERLVALMPQILASPVVSYDFESSDKVQHPNFRQNDKNYVDVLAQELAGISINYGENLQQTVYISFDHIETGNFDRAWATWVLQSLDSRAEPCVVQNASFELAVAQKNLGYMPKAPYDTAIMASYVDENLENGLKFMSRHWFNYSQATYKEVTKGRRMDEMAASDVLSYGCDDALLTSHLFDLFRIIMHLEGSWEFYQANEVEPAVDDAWSFIEGTLLDLERLKALRRKNNEGLEAAEERVRSALTGRQQSEAEATAAAQTLLQEWWLTERYRYLKNPQGMKEGYQALWERAWKSCFYTPVERTEVGTDFSTTPGDLARLVMTIDPQAPRPAKLTKKGLKEYDLELSTYLSKLKRGTDHHALLSDFQTLLWQARNNLAPAKRKGSEYERLQSFGQMIFAERLPKKVVTSGTALNFGSGPQMQGFLYGLMGLPVRRRSKAIRGSLRERERLLGSPSTGIKAVDAALVWDVRENDWRRPVLLDYREIAKMRQLESLYFSKYPNWVSPETGKLHPQIRNCGTVTRRPAGNSPNMLQISKGEMRTMFPAGEGRVFVSLDFASQEIALTACASGDPVMLDAFTSRPRKDIHSLTASGIAHRVLPRLGISQEQPMSYEEFLAALHSEDEELAKACKQVRNKFAKALNFGIVYGSSAIGVAENLQIQKEEAEELMDGFFRLYRRIQPWQREVAAFAREHGYVEMPFGSRRHAVEDLWSDDRKLSARQDRQLSNAVIQSGAAEILKVVRQALVERSFRERYAMRSVFFIYDEVTSSVPIEVAHDYILELAEVMRVTPPGYPVGMEVEASIGLTWGNQIELGIPSSETIMKAIERIKA